MIPDDGRTVPVAAVVAYTILIVLTDLRPFWPVQKGLTA